MINYHQQIAASRIERTDAITKQKEKLLYILFGIGAFLSILNYLLSRNKIQAYMLKLVKAEIELQQNLEVVDSSAIVSTTDINGKIIEINDNFCRISGYSREELIGSDHRLINSGIYPKEFFQNIWETILAGHSWSGEIQNKTKTGEPYWVQTYISPLYDENRNINRFHSIHFNITDKKIALQQVEHSAKMATLGQMAGAIAHEINNPLAIICGSTHILKRLIAKDQIDLEKFNETLIKIEATSSRISKIIKGLSRISRNTDNDPMETCSVSSIVTDSIELCKERFHTHEIELKILSNCEAEIECRSSEVSQVVLNLLNNAHDAVEMLPIKWVELEVKSNDRLVMITVTDSGNGIKKDTIDKMMTPYFSTKEVGKGTGLGLSISKRIIIEHKGDLRYDTVNNHTRFTIEIPKVQNVLLPKAA